MLLAAIRRAGVTRRLEYDPADFRITSGDGDAVQMLSLGNAYEEYRRAGRGARRGVLERWARISVPRETPSSFSDVRPNLLPRLRDRAQYDRIPLQLKLQGMDPPPYAFRVLAEHLAVGLVHDLPESVAEMPADQFERWGVPLDEAFAVAHANLERLSPRPFERIAHGVFLSPYRDNHDASRMTLVDRIRKLPLRGSPVAMAPNRDTLLITGEGDAAGLELMARLTEAALEEPRPISGIPVWLDDDVWRPFVPDEDHPMYLPFGKLRVLSLAGDYASQKQLLDALHQKTGEDVFVATYSVIEHEETRRFSSYCTWAKDVRTLLPRTDHVVLIDPDAPGEPSVMRVPWELIARELGHRMKEVEMYPPRLRVDEFPTADELVALKT